MTEKPRSIRATRIGGHAWQYLAPQSCKGRVVSSFSGGINLLFEGGEAFVPVQTCAVPLHPWAIEILGEPLRFAEGTPVSADEKELSFGDAHVVLSSAQIEELSLPRFSAEGVAIARRNFPILTHFVEEARKEHPPDPFQPQIDAILRRWHESSEADILLDLIGLGAGATPSGDDVLVGIIAAMSLFEHVQDQAKETLAQLRTGIQETACARTTLPSAQMLLAACEQSFGEPILEFIEEITLSITSEDSLLEKIRSVYQLGHHSGYSILLGFSISLRDRPTHYDFY